VSHGSGVTGQVGQRNQDFIMSWQGMKAALESISALIVSGE
jgi:hypothetical protein